MVLNDRSIGLGLAAVSLFALAAALTSQYAFGLAPCELCLYQRVPYAVVVALGLLVGFGPTKTARPLLAVAGGAFLIGSAIAVFHVGVEHKWWEGTDSCGMQLDTNDLEALRQQILNAPRARCDTVAWSLFGISMAGYNALISFGLSIFTFGWLRRK